MLDDTIPYQGDGSILELSNLMDELVLDDNNIELQPEIVADIGLPEVPNTTHTGRTIRVPQRYAGYDMTT